MALSPPARLCTRAPVDITNTSINSFVNLGNKINDNWDFYGFGGFTMKEVIGGVFSRSPDRTSRAVLEIFPDGYNPEVPSELTDFQVLTGVKEYPLGGRNVFR